ncbi:hypothetical protein OAG24_01175 [bacterium]|nr:hypothetical protein [bacterium]
MPSTPDRKCSKPYTAKDKLIVSIMAGLLFILISSPVFYGWTNNIFNTTSSYGCPTYFGLILHSVIFIAIVWILMK